MKVRALEISHGHVAVFQSVLSQPSTERNDAHLSQGFAWRPGGVSFATLQPAGPLLIEVAGSLDAHRRSVGTRIIAVPFEVEGSGTVEIASIFESRSISLAPAHYRLLFEHGIGPSGSMWSTFSFELATAPVHAEIILADPGLRPGTPLRMDAGPA